jgi:hypothetical protein
MDLRSGSGPIAILRSVIYCRYGAPVTCDAEAVMSLTPSGKSGARVVFHEKFRKGARAAQPNWPSGVVAYHLPTMIDGEVGLAPRTRHQRLCLAERNFGSLKSIRERPDALRVEFDLFSSRRFQMVERRVEACKGNFKGLLAIVPIDIQSPMARKPFSTTHEVTDDIAGVAIGSVIIR